MPCAIDGCDGKVFGRGWCAKHYMRWSRGKPIEADHVAEPQEFVREREKLLRVERGTGDTGKSDERRNQRENDDEEDVPTNLARRDREVKLPYLRFLDPAQQRVKTE